MQRSSLSLRDFILWTQTRLQPQTWSLTLRLWWPTLRPALRQIAPQSREKSRFISTAISRYIAVFLCPKSFFSAFSFFSYLNENALFSKPTYAALLSVLDNYNRMTGQAENFSSQQVAEQDKFVRETMSNTQLGRELFAFLYNKGKTFLCMIFHLHASSAILEGRVRLSSCVFNVCVYILRHLQIRGRLHSGPKDDVVWSVLSQQQPAGLQRLWAHLCRFGQSRFLLNILFIWKHILFFVLF